MKILALGKRMGMAALLGVLISGQAAPAPGGGADPLPVPPSPPPVPGQPAGLARPTTNPLVRPRPLPARGTNLVPAPRPSAPLAVTNASPALQPFPLAFEAESQTIEGQPGQTNATFTFRMTNTSPAEVVIDRVQTSCGCTVPRLPSMPWRLAPGARGEFDVIADLRGKRGLFSKMVYVYTSKGFKALNVRVNMAEPAGTQTNERLRNLQLATADRQAVLRGDCARCHAEPGKGKKGRELFQAICGVCHEAEHRASMVPDLRNLRHPTDAEHWRTWVTHGKAGTLMPAFAQSEGGPLSSEQIDSLVSYLVQQMPSRPPAAPLASPARQRAPASQ